MFEGPLHHFSLLGELDVLFFSLDESHFEVGHCLLPRLAKLTFRDGCLLENGVSLLEVFDDHVGGHDFFSELVELALYLVRRGLVFEVDYDLLQIGNLFHFVLVTLGDMFY